MSLRRQILFQIGNDRLLLASSSNGNPYTLVAILSHGFTDIAE